MAFCFGRSTRLAESGVAASALRSSGAWLRRKQRSGDSSSGAPRPPAHLCACVIRREVSWSKSSFFWGTSPCRRPSGTSDANSGSIMRLTIGSGSNRPRRDSRRFRLTCRHLSTDRFLDERIGAHPPAFLATSAFTGTYLATSTILVEPASENLRIGGEAHSSQQGWKVSKECVMLSGCSSAQFSFV